MRRAACLAWCVGAPGMSIRSAKREVLLHVGGPGLWTGEYPLISGARSINSVIADAPTAAVYLSAREWHRIVSEEPHWMRHFAQLLAERFAMAFRAYAEAQALSHDEWVYARLRLVAQIEREHGATTPQIQLSQSHLASMLGVSRQTLNAALARLRRRGLLRVGFRTIELVEQGAIGPPPRTVQDARA